MAKLSGALADRIDITLTVDPPPTEELNDDETEGSRAVQERVMRARRGQVQLGPGGPTPR